MPGHAKTYQTSRAGTKHEDVGAQLGANLLEAVAGAGCRLKQGGVDPVQVLELEDLCCGIGAVLGEAAVHGDAVGVELVAVRDDGPTRQPKGTCGDVRSRIVGAGRGGSRSTRCKARCCRRQRGRQP